MNTACAVFLIEESPSMKTRIAEGTHSRLDSIATAVNSAIRQMEGMPSIDVAIIGYHRDADGNPVIGSRWSGPFAGKIWVSSDELVANPVRIETRAKHMVNPVTRAVTQMTVEFPVWFDLIPGAGRLQYTPVYEYLAQILTDWINQTEPAIPPLIFSFLSDLQPNDSISNAVIPLGKVSTPQGFPMLLQFHVGAYTNVPAIKYPTVAQFLPYGAVQELFYACSPLTDFMFTALCQNQEFPAAGAKALVYNGRMIDIVRCSAASRFTSPSGRRALREPNLSLRIPNCRFQTRNPTHKFPILNHRLRISSPKILQRLPRRRRSSNLRILQRLPRRRRNSNLRIPPRLPRRRRLSNPRIHPRLQCLRWNSTPKISQRSPHRQRISTPKILPRLMCRRRSSNLWIRK